MTVAMTGMEGPVGAAIATALGAHPGADARPLARVDQASLVSRSLAEAALAAIASSLGPIEALIHAHVPPAALQSGALAALSDEQWDARCEAPLRATINLMQAAHGHLKEHGGVIIVVQPTVGLAGQRQFAAYAAACEAQRTLVKSTARAWGRRNIRSHTVVAAPELFGGELGAQASATSMLSPLSLRGVPAETLLANLVATLRFLLGGEAAAITGSTTAIDSGRWMPL